LCFLSCSLLSSSFLIFYFLPYSFSILSTVYLFKSSICFYIICFLFSSFSILLIWSSSEINRFLFFLGFLSGSYYSKLSYSIFPCRAVLYLFVNFLRVSSSISSAFKERGYLDLFSSISSSSSRSSRSRSS